MYSLGFAYPFVWYVFLPALLMVIAYRFYFYTKPFYSFSLSDVVAQTSFARSGIHHTIFYCLRLALLASLIFFIARPEWVDKSSLAYGQGRDIVLAIDVSSSMRVFDDGSDRRSRIRVAKEEAISFIEKRYEDPIGIVVFGRDALSLCPVTLDKNILKEVVGGLELGVVNPDGTALGTGLATAVNRLRKSKSKSKVIILLTDGEPTEMIDKVGTDVAIKMAEQFGIKVYTIGIGSEQGGLYSHPLHGVVRAQFSINIELLKKIAHKTGGQFFRANNPAQMKKIYKTIDKLERSDYSTNIFQNRYQAFTSFFWIVLLLFFLELFLRIFVWRVM